MSPLLPMDRGNRGGVRPDVLIELLDQTIHIHSMHQSPVFQGIEGYGKATTATHLEFVKKLYRLRVGVDYLVDGGIFLNNHDP
jgi:hypothetical protein